ncbi:glycoside hydrolase [Chitinophaga agrisoli]|uniref:Glycoside hydrolase n=1 Tax=Chitinophaga agrisoli TaxID=2607653 RepID=A0A5B2VN48_9BACT|nr:glycosyl hydrolase [Chitinophaga agrisoli]KAA2239846.1 glycoside hydrolase [Chitinophaga agrisoli]
MSKLSYRLILLLIISVAAQAQTKEAFLHPPASAMPRTWWHWTQSNISKEGITKDLEWMKRAGIAGMQLSDVASGGGQDMDKKTLFGSPEWLDAVQYAAAEAKRLGLEMTMFTSAGWSLTGGPWVKPEQAMKKLVWSETKLRGGTSFTGKLPLPPDNIGPIRNLSAGNTNAHGYYADCAVIAFPTPPAENNNNTEQPKISSGTGTLDAGPLLDDDLNSFITVRPAGKPGPVWIQFTYDHPFSARAATIAGRKGIPAGRLLASDDGATFKVLAELPGKQGYRGGTVRTFAFPETQARYYRFEFTGAPFKPAEVISQVTTLPDSAYLLSELQLHTGARIHRWEDKAGFNFLFEYESTATPAVPANTVIKASDIIVLTPKMSADGTLQWNVPKGNWTVMRFGYSLTGAKNRPAVPAGLGYEVDKLSRKHVTAYMQQYTAPLMRALGPLYGTSLQYMIMDSWEAGIQNWTDEMPAEFQRRRGYDLLPFLPALAGHVVNSATESDRVLWDFRRTLVDLFAEEHYGTVTDFLHQQGIHTYGEAGGVSLESMEDALLNKKYVDIPMGEFWVRDLHPSSMYYQDVRGAASAAHVYGKNLVAAEAFTGGNYESPYTLKKISDYWFTQGINRLVFHTSAHQPLDTKPGNTMVGTHINRNITWAELAKPFTTYLSRIAYLLQQGQYVADLVYLLNEGAPSTMPFWGAGLQPSVPEGYAYDYINADALVSRMSVNAAGRLTLPDGMSYAMLILPATQQMTTHVLRRIKALVDSGATVVGPRPTQAPGRSAYPAADEEISRLANDIWGDLDGVSRTMRTCGKGRVIWGMPLNGVLDSLHTAPDVSYSKPLDTRLSWIHRRDGDKDLYFISNNTDAPRDLQLRFRISGREPEYWTPDNGHTAPAAYQMDEDFTTIPMHLEEREAVFVVFDKPTTATARNLPQTATQTLTTLEGPWDISFAPGSGAPEKARFEKLIPWTTHPDEGIKYFSGTAVYHKQFEVSKDLSAAGKTLMLDLGKVADIAQVYLNDKPLDTLWKPPYRANITGVLKPGANRLEIRVTNEWTNRLVGDGLAQPGKKILASSPRSFGRPYKLQEAGLLGPVTIITTQLQ